MSKEVINSLYDMFFDVVEGDLEGDGVLLSILDDDDIECGAYTETDDNGDTKHLIIALGNKKYKVKISTTK